MYSINLCLTYVSNWSPVLPWRPQRLTTAQRCLNTLPSVASMENLLLRKLEPSIKNLWSMPKPLNPTLEAGLTAILDSSSLQAAITQIFPEVQKLLSRKLHIFLQKFSFFRCQRVCTLIVKTYAHTYQ